MRRERQSVAHAFAAEREWLAQVDTWRREEGWRLGADVERGDRRVPLADAARLAAGEDGSHAPVSGVGHMRATGALISRTDGWRWLRVAGASGLLPSPKNLILFLK
uniref:Uncharacterized protein n=1 Tax=Cannabis sativa TaxID=3483 RepID=A0A803NGE2_CANSA